MVNNNKTMVKESTIPQQLITGALSHFEFGVPISDTDMRREHKDRLARVDHVYWQWVKNPFLDVFPMFKQLVKGKGADIQSEWRMAQKDKWLFDFVVEHVSPPSRRADERKVRVAAEQAIRIGLETDNVQALTKGGKLLYDVAGLDKPESERADLSKVMFIPPVITNNATEVDPTKTNVDDKQSLSIMKKYGAAIDDKRRVVDEKVEVMLARRAAEECHTEGQETAETFLDADDAD